MESQKPVCAEAFYGKAVYDLLLIESNELEFHDLLRDLLKNWNSMTVEQREKKIEELENVRNKWEKEWKKWKKKYAGELSK